MSRRGRAVAFGVVAVACAGLAAAIADGYGTSVASQFGELRPVLVAAEDLHPGRVIGPRDLNRRLEVRRVPVEFVPPDALAGPDDAIGRAPAAPVPAGSYVLASQLQAPRPERDRRPALAEGRRPVEIAVTGAEALAATGRPPEGSLVDVVVTTEPGPGGRGRTFVAADGVELLALSEGGGDGAGGDPLSPSGTWRATLALTRREALRLIQAESFARQVRLMPHLGRSGTSG